MADFSNKVIYQIIQSLLRIPMEMESEILEVIAEKIGLSER